MFTRRWDEISSRDEISRVNPLYSDVKNQFHPGVSKYFDATRKNYAFFNPGVNFAPVLKTGVK